MARTTSIRSRKGKGSTTEKATENINRYEMIALEAYLRAEQRGFDGGDPLDDWLEAEAEVNSMLDS